MCNAGNASSEHLKGPKIQSFQGLRARTPWGAYIAPRLLAAPLTRIARLLVAALLFHNVKLFSVSAPVIYNNSNIFEENGDGKRKVVLKEIIGFFFLYLHASVHENLRNNQNSIFIFIYNCIQL